MESWRTQTLNELLSYENIETLEQLQRILSVVQKFSSNFPLEDFTQYEKVVQFLEKKIEKSISNKAALESLRKRLGLSKSLLG